MASILSAFLDFPKEAEIIGRLLAGYGEVEFDLMTCTGAIIDNFEVALKVMFRARGESARIDIADAVARPQLQPGKLRSLFESAISNVKFCVQIRNQYAHCNWLAVPGKNLTFVNLEEAAKSNKPTSESMLKQRQVDLDLLDRQEAYFVFVSRSLQFIRQEAETLAGKSPTHAFEEPKQMTRPPLHN